MLKHLSLALLTGASLYLLTQNSFVDINPAAKASEENPGTIKQAIIDRYYDSFERPLRAGDYLASRHAQIHHDWKNANHFVQNLIKNGINNQDIQQRAMVLSIGAGDTGRAIELAKQIKKENPDQQSTISNILLTVEAIKNESYDKAEALLSETQEDGTIKFVKPFIQGWIDAANGKLAIENLQQNAVQLYHGILISDFLNDHSQMKKMIDHALSVEDITSYEIERIADLYTHVGLKDKALGLYDFIIKAEPDNKPVQEKIAALKSDTTLSTIKKIKTANEGIAQAFSDISKILYNENNDETAHIFGHLALYLAPDMTETKFLLAGINNRHERYDNALTLYQSIPAGDPDHLLAQREIATLYAQIGRIDDAVSMLESIIKEKPDIDTLIEIGDLNRRQSNFGLAIKAYDRAYNMLGDDNSGDYWHLYYVRGISYEQANNWERAEQDLQTALKYQPDHPYILNYLGYAWADKGMHLDKALPMIKRAAELRPSDGYITDSLGWVMYRTKDYVKAVSALERAVELLPYDPTINDHLGDAYWKVGRKLEARFQWERAKNHSEDTEQVATIEKKLVSGLME